MVFDLDLNMAIQKKTPNFTAINDTDTLKAS